MTKVLLVLLIMLLTGANIIIWQQPGSMLASYVTSLTSHMPILTALTAFVSLYAFGLLRTKLYRKLLFVTGFGLPLLAAVLLTSSFIDKAFQLQPFDIFVVIEIAIISILLTHEIALEKTDHYRLFHHDAKQDSPINVYKRPSRAQ